MTLVTRHLLFGTYALGVALLNAPVLRGLFEMGRDNPTASHLALIPLVSLALVYLGRQEIFESVRFQRVGGASIVGTGLAVWLFGWTSQTQRDPGDVLVTATVAVIILWAGGFLFLYGRAACRRARFPILFLAFMVPIPEFVLDAAVSFLKTGSAETIGAVFRLTGTPYYREGFVFALPNVVIEVADECSGIRSSIGLLLTSLLAGHFFLKTSWKRLVVVAAVIPLAIFKNGARIASLSLLSLHVDPSFLTGRLHHEGGIVFFLLALAFLAPLFSLLGRSEALSQPGIR